ncbi:hypothetical protein FOZ60_010895 [Perkinsus olseni]|uniref:CCHC-type domain-containing protein n=2 Tax=Perkinsus olseni TaxID=32597 RepID=A0A7J6PBE1_PEROL|nr:hypothetical protein FOZ60_010895 [Perkinsus olseni]
MTTTTPNIRKGNCYRCNKPGHRAGVCRSQNVYQLNKRCGKCEDFSHSIVDCMRTLLTPCPRCRKPGHMAGVCIEPAVNHQSTTSTTATNNADSGPKESATTESALMATQVDASFSYLNAACNTDLKLVTVGEAIDVPIHLPLHQYCRVLPVADNYNQGVLCRAQIDDGADVRYEERPTKVTYRTVFGNNEVQHHNTAVLLKFRLCSDDGHTDVDSSSQVIELPFLVARPCTPRLLFERPALPFLRVPASGNQPLFDEISNDNGTIKLKANIPMLETATVMPRSESSRSRSTTDRYILADVCDRMVADGELARVSPDDEHKITCINEPVLVDKQDGLRVRRHPIPDSDVNRCRVTIDLRSVNELQLRDGIWIAPRTVHSKNLAAPQRPYQFKDTAAMLLRDFPPSSRQWFAKIDLADAFSSIPIDSALGDKLFGIRVSVPGENRPRIYAGRGLIQGWRWSSLVFARSVRYVLNKLMVPPGSHICHVQNDVIIGSHSKEACLALQRRVIDLFRHYSSPVWEDKCGDGPTITFCSLKTGSHTILPAPKHSIDEKAIDHCLRELDDATDLNALLRLLRRWAGTFRYCKQWLPPEGQQALAHLYSIIGKASQADASFDLLCNDAKSPLRSLGHLYVRGLPSLYLFRPWAIATLLATDANVDNWAGVAISVIQVPNSFLKEANVPVLGTLFKDLVDLCRRENIVVDREDYEILCLPAAFDGGSFHSNSFPGSALALTRSSTFRERAAQILFANRNSRVLAGLVYGVTDNVNTIREWQSAITDFCGAWHSLYSNYISTVEKILWLPRTSPTVALIDALARECTVSHNENHDEEPNIVNFKVVQG